MKNIYMLFGLIFLIGSFFFVKDDFNKFEVVNDGKIVEMEIVDKPKSCLGTKVKWIITLNFQGNTYTKQVSGMYCENHYVGQKVKMRFLDGNPTILFPDEGIAIEFISSCILGMFGIFLMIKSFTK